MESLLPTQITEESRADALLAVSELATNAVEHGAGDTFVVEVRSMPDTVELTVESLVAAGFSPNDHAPRAKPPSPTSAPSGRGLAIVQALSDRFDTRIRDGRFVASCRMCLRTSA